ncbi:hypothetical protein C8E87_1666 [Paractinoplanes brasiliensis]|uniref:Uncharacterized protein n=1 Tax=Paractinoplanes brasiliensis TaxID=52695 RepID=A0A4R6JNL7_9ACTN|nr:hypothetical protein C8E87_1666 [Actinoplanes brasiliensis]
MDVYRRWRRGLFGTWLALGVLAVLTAGILLVWVTTP